MSNPIYGTIINVRANTLAPGQILIDVQFPVEPGKIYDEQSTMDGTNWATGFELIPPPGKTTVNASYQVPGFGAVVIFRLQPR